VSNYNVYLTDEGRAFLADVISQGEGITNAVISLSSVVKIGQEAGITYATFPTSFLDINPASTAVIDSTTVRFSGIASNATLAPGNYPVSTIGILVTATNIGNACVAVATSANPDVITGLEGLTPSTYSYDINLTIDDTDNLTVAYTTSGVVMVTDIINNLTSPATDKPLSAAQGAALKALIDNADNSIVATVEESPATADHAEGDYIYYNSTTYEVTAAITIGDTLTVGTNIDVPTLTEGTVIFIPDIGINKIIGGVETQMAMAQMSLLKDVNFSSLTDGDVPTYNAGTQKFVNKQPAKYSNDNLFLNSWFTVNQRGTTSGTIVANTYYLDMWKFSYGSTAGTFSLGSSGLTLSAASGTYAQFRQGFEDPSIFNGKTWTISAMLSDGTVYSATLTRVNDTIQEKNVDTNLKIRWDNNNGILFMAMSGASYTFRAVKLELGSTSTLALDVAPNYITELMKCKRYLRVYAAGSSSRPFIIGQAKGTDSVYATMQVDVPFKSAPTLTTSGTFFAVTGAGSEPSITSLVLNPMGGTLDLLTFVGTTSGLTSGQAIRVAMSANAKIILSAEL
jgi:hypothetical protein